jgi:hypothetical protein
MEKDDYEVEDVEINTLTETEFKDLKNSLLKMAIEGIERLKGEELAFAFEGNVVLNEKVNELSESERTIIIAHECAHAIEGIEDEEEADFWALNCLDDEEKNMLISMWKYRHGHDFEDSMYMKGEQ